jgi:hypothetical protein
MVQGSIDPEDPVVDRIAAHLADPGVDDAEVMAEAIFSLARSDEFVAELIDVEGSALVRGEDDSATSRFEFGTGNFVVSCVVDHVERSIKAAVVPRVAGPIDAQFEIYLDGDSEPLVPPPSASGVLDVEDRPAGRTRLRVTCPVGSTELDCIARSEWFIL